MINKIPVITIDGPSGVGKSTLSKIISDKLNWSLLESGKIYRLVACLALKENISIIEKNIINLLNNLDDSLIKKKNINFFYNSRNINIISEISSQLSVYPRVRKILLKKQRLMRCLPGLIAEGRDMGTVVFPDAVLKFFLNADLKVRVKRRMLELKKNGYHANFQELFAQMKNRDERDQNRLISPLCAAKNAIILDSTNMSLLEVFGVLMKYIIKKIKI
ncbi:cytidylate kinase [Buchnera aphidicola str. Ak (Acyrthosiphon kondoi)]|uniref:Cytidylate kinase n=1 Tax=Buchnera aphidicola str. Ak (Acyrthosiphon kondoi) TaxID=1005090 RepID=G2LN24_9GAMM|nr:(d)CMP kinase [Buchnera aphidicola]AEO08662.1 cytidylate kinase [Buchnera aphidicola str. Ak (Acyrthosiphon kondoi)]